MHTKGPWKVATITETQLPAVVQVDGPVIAEITKWGSVGTVDLATAWDNARLIAVVPELFELIVRATSNKHDYLNPISNEWQEDADQLIRKAKE